MCGVRNPSTCKKLSEDCSFQDALQVAIVNEIEAKETLQVQQKQTPQPVNEFSKIRRFRRFTCSASGIETRFSSKFTVFKPSNGKHLFNEFFVWKQWPRNA